MKDYKLLQQQYIVGTYPFRGLTITKGDGVYLYNETGEKYLDMMSNYGVNILGYNHPVVTKALIDQLQKITVLHGSFANDARAMAALNLVKRCGGGLQAVYFCNSGAEAVEAALKFAVLATGRKKLVACKKGYHGKTLGALSVTHGEKYRAPFEPLLWDVAHVEINNIEELEKVLNPDVAAFIVEPIQGEGSLTPYSPGYLSKAKELCAKHGVLLIIDEIQSGMGRTGTFLASHRENMQYDIVCLGKGLGGGIPIGATIVSKEVNAKIPKNSHTSTFGGNPLACAGINVTLEVLNDELLHHVKEVGKYFLQELRKVKSSLIVHVQGEGLMIGFEVSEHRDDILKQLQQHKILAIPGSPTVVRFRPPYLITKEQVDEVVRALQTILNTYV